MRRLPTFLRILAATSAFVAPNLARAVPPDPVPSLDLRNYRPSTDPVGGLFIEPASTPAHLDSNVGLSLSYARVPVRLHGMITGEVFNVIAHQLTGDLVGSIGLGENYSVGIDLPFIVAQTGDTLTKRETEVLGPMNLPAQAFGDVALTVKAVLIQPTAGKMGGFALAFHNRFTVPTGDRGSFLGEGHVTNTSRLFAELRILLVGVHLAGGLKLRAEAERFSCANVSLVYGVDPCPQILGTRFPSRLVCHFGRRRWESIRKGAGHFCWRAKDISRYRRPRP